jgi:tRNA-dihydrouridine synthase A
MIGRAAYDNPYLFALADTLYFADAAPPATRRQVLAAMIPYVEHWGIRDVAASSVLRHMLGLFAHQRVAKAWKRLLSTSPRGALPAAALLRDAIRQVPDAVLDDGPQGAVLPLTCSAL